MAIAISSSVRFASPRPPPLFAKHPAAIFANAVAANPEKSHARQLRRKEGCGANPATFVLMVIIGTSPPRQRGEFHSYHQCYEAAQGEVANLGLDVRWDCVPKSSV